MQAPTKTQEQRWARVLSYLMWMHASWKSPTVREIGSYMGWSSTSTTFRHLTAMLEHNLIAHIPGSPRTYRVTDKGLELLNKNGGIKIDTKTS